MIIVLALATLLAADPCEPLAPASGAPATDVESYLRIADEEERAGHPETALAALRGVLEKTREPRAESAWWRICEARARAAAEQETSATSERAYADALGRVEREDWRGALGALEGVRSPELRARAALLAGVAHHQLGRAPDARRALEVARDDPATAETARLFLALAAQRAGDAAEARRWIAQVARSDDPVLRDSALLLQQSLRTEGRLNVTASAGVGYDSNVNLAPPGASAGAGNDGLATALVSATGRPLGPSGPFVQAMLHARQQFRLHDFSLYGVQAAAGWEWARDGARIGGQYAFDSLWLGGAGYLMSHRVGAWAYWPLGDFSVSGGYEVSAERYFTSVFSDFSGVRHTGFAGGGWGAGIWSVSLRYRASWNGTRQAALTSFDHGPAVEGQVELHQRVRAFAGAQLGWRPYVFDDATLGLRRSDLLMLAHAGLSVTAADGVWVRGTFVARGNRSNVATLRYVELVAMLSVVASWGFF